MYATEHLPKCQKCAFDCFRK
uniref:Uncharacterized protein n=1 Tax=Anguilla anguilla TaxID=7936 RepID=A0A0E9QEV4_ANGAN